MIRIAVALVVFVAAAAKCYQCCMGPIPGDGLFSAKWFVICLVETEWLGVVALLLLADLLPRPVWVATLTCFSGFTVVSLTKGLAGEASCGCFGRWQLNPFLTATMDATIVALLLRWRPHPLVLNLRQVSMRAIIALLVWLAVGVPAAFAMGRHTETTLSDRGDILGKNMVVVLEPQEWIGKTFPLLKYIDIGDELTEGDWGIVLFHHDCRKCREVMRDIGHIAREYEFSRICLLEMPPYGDSHVALDQMKEICRFGRLDDTRDWFAATPIVMALKGGRVVAVNFGK